MAPIGKSEVTTALLVVAVIGGGLAVVSDDPLQLLQNSAAEGTTDRSGEVGSTPAPTATAVDREIDSINESELARELWVYLNARRTDNEDTTQFVWSPEISNNTERRAEWMASHQSLDHPEEASYRCGNREVSAFTYAYGDVEGPDGETVSFGGDETAVAKGLLNQWEASEPTRKLLYGSPYYQGGAGVATVETDDGIRVYAVMAFCQR